MTNVFPSSAVCALAGLMAGCDMIGDFQVNNMVREYRQTCFGQFTNDCVEMRVDTNIEIASHFLDEVEDNEDEITANIGEAGYDEMVGYLNWLIDINEKDRPGWIASWFLGEAQPWDRNFEYGQFIISGHDIESAFEAIVKRQVGEGTQQETPLDFGQASMPSSNESGSEGGAPVDQYIAGLERQYEADEYRDARMSAIGDVDGDGILETATVFTLEGMHGSNRYGQFLVVHTGTGSDMRVVGENALAGSVTEIELGDGIVRAVGHTHAIDDPNCCPSIETEQAFSVTEAGLTAVN
ncbi:hypothetical protein [Halomonas sp. I5-271120]|uniref:hypothetical protein n=1 Tax=Halomonas sp. I5-271120 TaxID=3061632 RepID=UPI002714B695|nr:hypothetical protein [Halomonas sp. I5-271120]